MKEYSVTLWLTHPEKENDDCMTGEDFATIEEARACVANLGETFDMSYFRDCPFVMIDGPDVNEVTELPGVARRARREAMMDRAEERSERRMQAGMMGGIEAYNDAE